jgi:cation transport ATPase
MAHVLYIREDYVYSCDHNEDEEDEAEAADKN